MNSLATSPLPATATMSQLGSISRNSAEKCENQALSNDPYWRSLEVYDGSFGWEKTLKNGLGQRTKFVLACWDLWGFKAGKLHPSRVRHFCTDRGAVSTVFDESKSTFGGTLCHCKQKLSLLRLRCSSRLTPASCQACCMPWMQSEGLERKATFLSWTHCVVHHVFRSRLKLIVLHLDHLFAGCALLCPWTYPTCRDIPHTSI